VATGNKQGARTAVDNASGNTHAGMSSIACTMTNDSDNGNVEAKDAARKKTLVRNVAVAGNNGGNTDIGTSSIVLVAW
jgi:hypothetical protein